MSIPDNNSTGVTSSIPAIGTNPATDIKVDVNISHTYIGDLTVTLIAPSGNTYTLHSKSGGGADDIVKTFNVSVNNEDVTGDWQLKIVDSANADTGALNNWGIDFGGVACFK